MKLKLDIGRNITSWWIYVLSVRGLQIKVWKDFFIFKSYGKRVKQIR